MNASEAMFEEFVNAWPEPFTDDPVQAAKLLAAFKPETIHEAIADRLEAGLGRPGLAELSRVLRSYEGTPSKDPEPEPVAKVPGRPWIADMDKPPPVASDISERVAELRALVPKDVPKFERPERVVVDRDNLRIVPPSVYAAAEEGRRQFQANRRARLDAAK